MLTRSITVIILLVLTGSRLSVARESEPDSCKAAKVAFLYKGDMVGNLSGGIKTGSRYLGLAALTLSFNTEKGRLWRNGELFVNLANTHGGTPSADLVGDFQGFDNIEAGNRTFLQEFWYAHTLGRFLIKVGIQDLNVEFSSNDLGSLFIGSSFGIPSTFSANLPAPIFPVMGFGMVASYRFGNNRSVKVAIFDGKPEMITFYPAHYQAPFAENNGVLAIAEYTHSAGLARYMCGNHRLGLYYHNHITGEEGQTKRIRPNYGFYTVVNQGIRDNGGRGKLDAFLQAAFDPVKISTNHLYVGLGLICSGIFRDKQADSFGIAVAHAQFEEHHSSFETIYECCYRCPIGRYVAIQPILQYVVNPSGADVELPNALVGTLRVALSL